jgi:hypothetical protein
MVILVVMLVDVVEARRGLMALIEIVLIRVKEIQGPSKHPRNDLFRPVHEFAQG